jgi:hypothetical protein
MKITVFLDVITFSLVDRYQFSGGPANSIFRAQQQAARENKGTKIGTEGKDMRLQIEMLLA